MVSKAGVNARSVNRLNQLKTINGESIEGSGNITISPESNHNTLGGRDSLNAHPVESITGLQTALNGKQDTLVSGDNISTINGQSLLSGENIVVSGGEGVSNHAALTGRDSNDQHPIGAITGLQLALDDKANTLHNHTISQVTGLQSALDEKADSTHTQPISSILGLQDELNNKAAASSVTNLESTLNGKQDTLVSGTNIKTISGVSILGSGNIEVSNGDEVVEQKNYFNTRKSLKVELTRLSGVGFPNGFFIDEPNNDIYVGYARGSATNTTFARYNFTTGELIQSFTAGASNYPEGFAVLTVGGVKQLITRTTSSQYGAIGKYDITTVSVSGGNAPLISESDDIGAYYQMSFDGKWLYVEGGANIGNFVDRSSISIYDLDFNYVGQFKLNGSLLGDNVRPDLPKRQSFTVQNGSVIAGLGGAVNTGTGDSTRRYQGIVVMTTSGSVVNSMLCPHDSWLTRLNSLQGTTFTGTYSENEGTCAVPSGDVYSMWVTGAANNKSIKVVKEFSTDPSSTDFTDDIKNIPFLTTPEVHYPNRNRDRTMRKVLGSGTISTLQDIFIEMGQLTCRSLQFAYNFFDVTLDLPSSPDLSNAFIRITNVDNGVGYVEVLAPTYVKTYYVTNTRTGTISITEIP